MRGLELERMVWRGELDERVGAGEDGVEGSAR